MEHRFRFRLSGTEIEPEDTKLSYAVASHILMSSAEVTTQVHRFLLPVLLPVSYRSYNGTFSLCSNVTAPEAFVISDYTLSGQDGSLHLKLDVPED